MAYEDDGPPLLARDILHLAQTFILKIGISDREHFIYDEDLAFKMCCDGKGQPDIHAAAVSFDGRIDVALHFAVVDDLIESPADLTFAHAQDGTIQIDIFAAGEFGMKSGTYFKEGCDPSADPDLAGRRMCDAREELQQGTLTGTILSDDGHCFSLANGEIDILEAVYDIARAFYGPVVQRTYFKEGVRLAHHPGHHAVQITAEGSGTYLTQPV